MIIGITGQSETPDGKHKWSMGSGKDTVADLILKQEGWAKVAVADAMKRFARDLYGFTDEQLWGPSEMRNAVDERWPVLHRWLDYEDRPDDDYCGCCGMGQSKFISNEETPCYLTPRWVLVSLGNWGRKMHERTWANKVMGIANALMKPSRYLCDISHENFKGWRSYSAQRGLGYVGDNPEVKGVLVSDVRYREECRAIRESGGKIIRVKRIQDSAPETGVLTDSTEVDLITWDDSEFDHILVNDTLEGLPAAVDQMLERLA